MDSSMTSLMPSYGREQNIGGDAAIGRVPVVSANGEPLMPCKPAKAKNLLKEGKAVGKRGEDGPLYIQLNFDPSSPVLHPPNDSEYCVKVGKGSACEKLGIRFGRNIEDVSVEKKPEEPYDFPRLEDLRRARERGKRNGRYYKLKMRGEWIKMGLLDASIIYLRNGYRIVNSKLREALEDIVEMLEPTTGPISRRRILKKGVERAGELVDKFREIIRWAPQLSNWLKSEAYILWLGIIQITSPM